MEHQLAESVTPHVVISCLTFSDGTKVDVLPSDVTLIVGPNNAGKSATLRAIRDKLKDASYKSAVLQNILVHRRGTSDDMIKRLFNEAIVKTESPPDNPGYEAFDRIIYQHQARHEWQRTDDALGELMYWFCLLLSAEERLQICNPPSNIALARENPKHPIHFLLRDDELELRLSSRFRKAFGVDLVVHRNAGSQVPMHVGERPTPLAGEDRVSRSYIERLEKLPTLHTQGDGMRSFAGVLLVTSVGRESIMLIDEPEAFLHPPQARHLGTTLVQDRSQERQLFIATHSTDILRGVLDTESSDVRVIRICRNGTMNIVRLLSNERIKQFWGDPLLRYSNILDGLFHEGVVVCEADADCRFYAAVLDAVLTDKGDNARRPDLMFTHCAGKARLPVVIRALREVDIPVRAVADFDVLSDQEPLKAIVEALGVEWAALESDWRVVKTAIDGKKPDLNANEVKNQIEQVFAEVTTPSLPPQAKARIQTVLKQSSAWAIAKQVGKTFVPSGDPTKACERLLLTLRAGGLHVVEVGELEGYVRSEGGHGPKWVNAVLTRALAVDPELESARNFALELADSFHNER